MEETFDLGKPIKVLRKHANIDARYGPFTSLSEALSSANNSLGSRKQGRLFGVIEDGRVVDYYFPTEDVSDGAVERKNPNVAGTTPVFVPVTMTDIGALESETWETIEEKLGIWIESQGFIIPAGEIWFFELERVGGDSGGGGSDLTLEQARQNGNTLEGNVELIGKVAFFQGDDTVEESLRFYKGSVQIHEYNLTNESASRFIVNSGQIVLFVADGENNSQSSIVLYGNELQVRFENNSLGIVGNLEFNKQGNRKAFAQLSDVYDGQSYSTQETKTGGTWIDGRPIYRRVETNLEMGDDIYIPMSLIRAKIDFKGNIESSSGIIAEIKQVNNFTSVEDVFQYKIINGEVVYRLQFSDGYVDNIKSFIIIDYTLRPAE